MNFNLVLERKLIIWATAIFLIAPTVGCSRAEKPSSKNVAISCPPSTTSVSADTSPTERAKQLFDCYVKLGNDFDPAITELYADDALIQNTRRYPDGSVKTIKIPAAQYKSLIQKSMPLAKSRGDKDSFSEVTYTPEGDKVRINAQRYSALKNYSSPLSLLVGSDTTGKWLIIEEISESKP
jgi:hypothetical protein